MLDRSLFHKIVLGLVVAGLVLTPLTSVFAQSEAVNVEPVVATGADTASNHIFLPLVQGSVDDNGAAEIRASSTVITVTQQIYAAFIKNNNLWVVNAGGAWNDNLLAPTGITLVGKPEIITYIDHFGVQYIDTFVRGNDSNNNSYLYVNNWNMSNGVRGWTNLGIPSGTTVVGDPAAVVTGDTPQTTQVGVFVTGSNVINGTETNGHLYFINWNGSYWETWQDRSTPPGATLAGKPGVTVDRNTTTVYVFVTGSDGQLHLWKWVLNTSMGWNTLHGTQPIATVGNAPGAISYMVGTNLNINAFVIGSDGHLYENSMNGTTWTWADRGMPAGCTSPSAPGVSTYLSNTHIDAFVRCGDGHLYMWDSVILRWVDRVSPSTATLVGDPSVITYGTLIYAFVKGHDSHLYMNRGNVEAWYWGDLGTPQ